LAIPDNKSSENKSLDTTQHHSGVKEAGQSAFQFKDERTATAQLQQLQQMANKHSAEQPTIQQKKNNTGLPDNLKSGIENLSGISMDDVKVHRNSDKPAQLNAHAYAQGTDIHLAPGQEKHLPHEAWHVVQQKQGRVQPTKQLKGKVNINDDSGLEKEADVMGAEANKILLPGDVAGSDQNTSPNYKTAQLATKLIQLKISASDKRNMAYFFGEEKDAKQFLQGLSKTKAWNQIDIFIKSNGSGRNKPTHQEIADYYKCEIEEPTVEVEETSDIKQTYDVKKACALQGLIGYGQTPYGKSTAKDVHDHIWSTPALAIYKEYDINWEALYRSLGLNKVANPADKVENLPNGNYLCEVHGHMMAVTVTGGVPVLRQDPGNAIGKVKDVILQTYQ